MKFVAALVPSLGMLLVGAVILRAVLYGDRREREAQKAWEARQDASGAHPDQPLVEPGDSVSVTKA